MKINKRDQKIVYLIIGIACFLVTVFGATYAYFSIQQNSANVKTRKVTGSTTDIATPTLVTNIEVLKLNLDAKQMDQAKVGTTYYATANGTPVTTASLGSGRYNLATASVPSGAVQFDCNYKYNVTGTVSKAISDGSDEDVKITFRNHAGTETTYTLKQVLSGVTYTSKFSKLKTGQNQTIQVSAYVQNVSDVQDHLKGNSFTFKIELVKDGTGFTCAEAQ